MYRIVIVDDQVPFRQMAKQILERDPNFEVVAEAGDGERADHFFSGLKFLRKDSMVFPQIFRPWVPVT